MVTPDEIENRVFSLVRRGYDPTEVDDFLQDVAAELARAQGGLQTPVETEAVAAPADGPAAEPIPEFTISGPDDFGRLGEEIAQILRQAHESVAEMRHRAEAEAALIRQNAQHDAEGLKAEADRDRQAAGVELEAARAETARILAEVQAQSDRAAESAAANALARAQAVVESAKVDARGAVAVQRNVRQRLEDARVEIDDALEHLVEEDQDLFATIDLTDAAVEANGGAVVLDVDDVAGDEDVPPPGEGPPSPPVLPPTRTTPTALQDLPYATDDDDVDSETAIDLTDEAPGDEPPAAPGNPFPLPPNPAPPLGDEGGAAAEVPDAPASDNGDDDALAQMVKNAVENALRRRKGDGETPNGNGV